MTRLARLPEVSLPDLLAARARATTDGKLVLAFGGGITAAMVIAALGPAGWVPLLGVALCVTTFGAWGIADRELQERPSDATTTIRMLRAARVVAAAVGVFAAMIVLFALLSVTLGTWIS